jgi:hypothetical protein
LNRTKYLVYETTTSDIPFNKDKFLFITSFLIISKATLWYTDKGNRNQYKISYSRGISMETRELIRGLLVIVTFCSFCLSVLSLWTYHRMQSVPKNKRNLLEYAKPKKFTNMGFVALIISVAGLILLFWI